jgi:virulence factor Mce-like protein
VNRRRNNSIAANPILIGGVTVLVTIVAVFLSYNANHGLPFVPTYSVDVVVPNSAGLIAGNEVRIGGDRVGMVRKITGFARADGSTGARMELALEDKSDHLPVDSTVAIRPKSPLGLKYLVINRGRATRTIPQGGTITAPREPIRPVDIDDWFNTYDEPTREGSAENLLEYGTAFAGRGGDLNTALRDLNPALEHAGPALENLNATATQLDKLFPALAQSAAEVAPIAGIQGQLFTNLAQTFKAFSDNTSALEAAITGGPLALDTATRELPAQAEFTNETTELFRRLKRPLRSFANASVDLAPALRAGVPALRNSPQLNGRLVDTLNQVDAFAGDERVLPLLTRLTRTSDLLDPLVSYVTPAQTTCNYVSLLLRNVGSALSESDVVGSMLRATPMLNPQVAGSEVGPSATPANGPADAKDLQTDVGDSFLRSNPYPNTAAPGQDRECEAGNEPGTDTNVTYPTGQTIGNVPGNQGTLVDKTTRPENVK